MISPHHSHPTNGVGPSNSFFENWDKSPQKKWDKGDRTIAG